MTSRLMPVAILALGFLTSDSASAQTLASAAATEAAAARQPARDQWQADYDRAKRKEKAGVMKMRIGPGVLALGLILGARTGAGPDSGNAALATGVLVTAGGGVLALWGVREYLGARNDLALLELNRPAGTSASLRFSERHALQVEGNRISYAVRW